MAYQYSFADNSEYGAEDLNSLVSSLVSSGVADGFEDGTAYNASKLNDVIQTVYSAGVVPSSVSTLQVTKTSDGVISIAPGLAFFADGSTIKITSAETLSYEAGSKNYVYLKQDLTAQNRNYPACTTTAPTGDFVILAEISAQGEVTDKRQYAQGKVPGYQSNANVCMTAIETISFSGSNDGAKTFSVDLGTNNYSRVFVIANAGKEGSIGVYNFTDGSYYSTYNIGVRAIYEASESKIVLVPTYAYYAGECLGSLLFSKSGQTVTGTLDYKYDGAASFTFTLVFC